jgi:hypothetical protein
MKAPKGTILEDQFFRYFEKPVHLGAKTGGHWPSCVQWGHTGVLRGRAPEGRARCQGKFCTTLKEVASIIVVPISASARASIVDGL